MLCQNVVVTLLVASISILTAGASEDGEQRALPNEPQTPIHKSGPVLEALTVQEDNVYKTGPNDRSIYGSIAQEETDVYESPDSSRPSSTRTRTAFAPGGPGQQGVSYARSEDPQYQEQPNQNQKPGVKGIHYGSYTRQSGNTYFTNPNDVSMYGSLTVQKNNKFYTSGGGDNQAPQNEGQIPTDQGNVRVRSLTVQTGNTYNGQTKLISNKFCLFLITWIGLSKYF